MTMRSCDVCGGTGVLNTVSGERTCWQCNGAGAIPVEPPPPTLIRSELIERAVAAYYVAERHAPLRQEQLERIVRKLTPAEFQEYARRTVKARHD